MGYKVIALDLDGTLTNSKKEITQRTIDALIKAQELGVTVVLASGRPTKGVMPCAKALKLEEYGGYILAFNGGMIMNCKTKDVIFQKKVPENLIKALAEASDEYQAPIITYDEEHVLTEYPHDQYIQLESSINKMPILEVPDFYEAVTFPVTKCLMTGDGWHLSEVEKQMKKRFGKELNIFRSEAFFLEIMPMDIDKAYSLNVLLKHLGYTKEQLIACGDGFNDLSMIKFAGLGVAMDNAKDVVKEAADIITHSNDDDGVAKVVEKYLN